MDVKFNVYRFGDCLLPSLNDFCFDFVVLAHPEGLEMQLTGQGAHLAHTKPLPLPEPHKPGVAGICLQSQHQEVEAGGSGVQDHPQQHSEFEASPWLHEICINR